MGTPLNQQLNNYGGKHKEKVYSEFVSKLDSTNFADWLYGVAKKKIT